MTNAPRRSSTQSKRLRNRATPPVFIRESEVETAYLETSEGWSPNRLVFGEWSGLSTNKSVNVCPMLWYGGTLHETTAKSISQMTSDLRSLAMLHSKTTVTRPG